MTLSNAGPDLQTVSAFKQLLRDRITILLEGIKNERNLIDILPNVAEQVSIIPKINKISYLIK